MFPAYSHRLPFEYCLEMLRINLLDEGDMLGIFEYLFDNAFCLFLRIVGDWVLFEFVPGQVVVFDYDCVSVHKAEPLGEEALGIEKTRHLN